MKLTEESKQKIKELHIQGMNTTQISKIVGITPQGVGYWLGDRENKIRRNIEAYRKLSIEKKREIYAKQREYRARYFKERYWNNPEFRERHRIRCREYKRNQKLKNQKA